MSQPAVHLDHLTCRFRRKGNDDLVAVDDFDLTIPMGQVYGLLGPNGSGKTTTVNVISALVPPTEGTCRVMGVDVRKDPSTVRSRIGVVPQETALYNDLSALENLQFHARLYRAPRSERQHRIDEVLDLVGLSGRRRDRVGTFSGGMQRRLALARALLTRPDIIILDEPTLGVDVQSRNALWERIRAQADDGGTVLLTTNYMEEAQALADDLAIIDHGKLVATGAPDEFAPHSAATTSNFIPMRPRPGTSWNKPRVLRGCGSAAIRSVWRPPAPTTRCAPCWTSPPPTASRRRSPRCDSPT